MSGLNQGTIGTAPPLITFSEMENLTGGGAADTFVFQNNTAGLTGNLAGSGGTDTVNFAARTVGVTVDLGTGQSTGVGGALSGMETLIGSSSQDTLIGPNVENTWNVTGGNSGNSDGAFAFSNIENLAGGSAADTFLVAGAGYVTGTIDGGEGYDAVTFTSTNGPDTVAIHAGSVTRNGLVSGYANIESVTVETLDGADTIGVHVAAAGFPERVAVRSGNHDDVMTVHLAAGATTAIEVDGGEPSASDTLIVNGTADADVISVAGRRVTFDGTKVDLIGIENLTIAGGEGDDQLRLGGETVSGTVQLLGQGGDDTITLNNPTAAGSLVADGGADGEDILLVQLTDEAETVNLSATALQVVGKFTADYGNFESLQLETYGGSDQVTIGGTHGGMTVVDTGDDGDTVTLEASAGELNVVTGAGQDTVYVRAIGAAAVIDTGLDGDLVHVSSAAPGTPGVLTGITAPLAIVGGEGHDTLTVDAAGDTAGLSGVLTAGQITGLGMTAELGYAAFENLQLTLGGGANRLAVQGTHAETSQIDAGGGDDVIEISSIGGPATVNGGGGSDTVNVVMSINAGAETENPIAALLTVVGGDGAGQDTLNVTANSPFDQTGTLTDTTIRGLRMPDGIDYSGLEALNIALGEGSDEFTIMATHAGTTQLDTVGGGDTVHVLSTAGITAVNTGDGADTVHVQTIGAMLSVDTGDDDDAIQVGSLAPDSGGTVNGIHGLLTVRGGSGADGLTVDDSGDAADNNGTLTATTLTGLGMSQGIDYGGLESLDILLGSGHDSLTVAGTHAGTTALTAGAGNDAIHVRGIAGATDVHAGAGSDTVTVGSLAPTLGGTVNGIAAPLIVRGDEDEDTLIVDDSGDILANVGQLTGTTLTGLGMTDGISYAAFEDLSIGLGSGGDTFTIADTHAGTTTLTPEAATIGWMCWPHPARHHQRRRRQDTVNVQTIGAATVVNAGVGNDDMINVGSLARPWAGTVNAISALLTVNGEGGSDT